MWLRSLAPFGKGCYWNYMVNCPLRTARKCVKHSFCLLLSLNMHESKCVLPYQMSVSQIPCMAVYHANQSISSVSCIHSVVLCSLALSWQIKWGGNLGVGTTPHPHPTPRSPSRWSNFSQVTFYHEISLIWAYFVLNRTPLTKSWIHPHLYYKSFMLCVYGLTQGFKVPMSQCSKKTQELYA